MLTLLVCLTEDFTNTDVRALRDLIGLVAHEREWALKPPQFIDELDDASCSKLGDEPIRTVGAVLRLDKRNGDTDRVWERKLLADTEFMIARLTRFSRERKCEIELELGGELVGDIRNGEVSAGITDGLLGEWRRRILQT